MRLPERNAAASRWATLRARLALGLREPTPQLAALAALSCALLVLTFAAFADARPGGGESFRGGSRSSGGSGGGGGDIGFLIDIIVLCIRYPKLGVPVLIVVVIWFLIRRKQGAGLKDWSVGVPQKQVQISRPHFVARSAIDRLRQRDPSFSVVLFEDFLYTLYAQIHQHRPGQGLAKLAPYLDQNVQNALFDPKLEATAGVLIGSMRYVSFQPGEQHVRITVEFEANMTETRGGNMQRLYLLERMTIIRPANARSRDPKRARTLDCPNCGAALEAIHGGQCSYCREQVTDGRFDWKVYALQNLKLEKRPPVLTGEVAEQGNELPTVVAHGAQQRLSAISQHDPGFDYQMFLKRVSIVFAELQAGWSEVNVMRIRPHVSDNLFQYFGYWLDMYGQSNARNVTENARITNIELSNVISDQYYDAITVRVRATGLDYTISNDGKLLKGSKSKERPYTEYWTLIRGRVAQSKPREDLGCPNCGAPLKVNMAGSCEYCHAKVVTGDFDWVLSRIEQDDNYFG